MSKTRSRKVEQNRPTLTCCPETRSFVPFLLLFCCGVEEAGGLGSCVGTGSKRSELAGRDALAIVLRLKVPTRRRDLRLFRFLSF